MKKGLFLIRKVLKIIDLAVKHITAGIRKKKYCCLMFIIPINYKYKKPVMRFHIFNSFLFMFFLTYSIYATEPHVNISVIPVKCHNDSNGELTIEISDVTQNYSAQLFKNTPNGKYLNPVKENDITIFKASDLNAGKYIINIKGDNGFSVTENINLPQPGKLESDKITIEKKLSSPEAGDAVLKANPSGGTTPYTYNWSHKEGARSQTIENVSQGIYSCTIDDANNCGPVVISIIFIEKKDPEIIEKQK